MILEWILVQNGHQSTFRFIDKLKALRGQLQFPPLFATRPWLQQRLVSLYAGLVPLRGTIIHDRNFQASSGDVRVIISKGGNSVQVMLRAADLRTVAAIAVSLNHYLQGSWTLDLFNELRLRYWLDQLIYLHKEPPLGQQEPGFLNVRIYSKPAAVFEIDLAKLRRGASAKRPGQQVLFDIRLVVVEPSGSSARAYLIPWSRHEKELGTLKLTEVELQSMVCPVPTGLNLTQLGAELASN